MGAGPETEGGGGVGCCNRHQGQMYLGNSRSFPRGRMHSPSSSTVPSAGSEPQSRGNPQIGPGLGEKVDSAALCSTQTTRSHPEPDTCNCSRWPQGPERLLVLDCK